MSRLNDRLKKLEHDVNGLQEYNIKALKDCPNCGHVTMMIKWDVALDYRRLSLYIKSKHNHYLCTGCGKKWGETTETKLEEYYNPPKVQDILKGEK